MNWRRLTLTTIFVLIVSACSRGQPRERDERDLYALARADRAAFARHLADGATSDFDRARLVVGWLAKHFDWKATDYEARTVEQILERKGGNCAELAVVADALFDELGIRKRRVQEINVHVKSERRQRDAEARVEQIGLSASVFGRGHNDHVWLEVFDEPSGEWLPADPSMGVVGLEPWFKARAWFGDRTTLDPASDDMLFPIGIFVWPGGKEPIENRTRHYMIDELDALYGGRLSQLDAWSEWIAAIDAIDDRCLEAFQGKTNLHAHEAGIERARKAYFRLRSEYRERHPQ